MAKRVARAVALGTYAWGGELRRVHGGAPPVRTQEARTRKVRRQTGGNIGKVKVYSVGVVVATERAEAGDLAGGVPERVESAIVDDPVWGAGLRDDGSAHLPTAQNVPSKEISFEGSRQAVDAGGRDSVADVESRVRAIRTELRWLRYVARARRAGAPLIKV